MRAWNQMAQPVSFNADDDRTGQGRVELLDGASLVDLLTCVRFARLCVER